MKHLLYKEFKLAINPLFYLIALFGALVLIPNWPYFIAMMYFFFIAVPNIFAVCKAQNDIGFSVMMPVRKRDVVKARFLSIIALELLQIFVTIIFAAINLALYPNGNFLLDANVSFFGFVFVMYAIYNVIFFPMFYKTAHKIGIPIILAITAAILFATAVEFIVLLVPAASAVFDGTKNMVRQLPVLGAGIAIYALVSFLAYKASVKRFERIDL